MGSSTKTPASQRPDVKKGGASAAPKKDFGCATAYANPSKTKAGVTGSKK